MVQILAYIVTRIMALFMAHVTAFFMTRKMILYVGAIVSSLYNDQDNRTLSGTYISPYKDLYIAPTVAYVMTRITALMWLL